MKRLLRTTTSSLLLGLAVLASLGSASGAQKPTLTQVPARATNAELEAMLPEVRAAFEASFTQYQLIELYGNKADWTPIRHEQSGVLLARETQAVFGVRDKRSNTCRYEVLRVLQDSMGDGLWGEAKVRYFVDGQQWLDVDCATLGSPAT